MKTPSKALLEVTGLAKSFGALQASDGIDLSIDEGEIHAIIGPNGAGKSTLVAQIGGQLMPDQGRIVFDGHDITCWPAARRPRLGLVRSFQITSIFPDFTALENVSMAVQLHAGHSFHFFANALRDQSLIAPAMRNLQAVGLAGHADQPAYALAHGQQRQLEIAMATALEPRMLVLDEPLAGMGQEEGANIVDLLRTLRQRFTIVLIEHDMDAVFALADRISVLVYGKIIATGTPDMIRENEQVREAYLGDAAPGNRHA